MRQEIGKNKPTREWVDHKGTKTPLSSMTRKQLIHKYRLCQLKELEHEKKACFFADMQAKLQKEAEERGITLKSINNEYFRHSKYYNNKSGDTEQ